MPPTATSPSEFWDMLRRRPFLPLAFAAGGGAAWGASIGAEAAHATGRLSELAALPYLLLLFCAAAALWVRASRQEWALPAAVLAVFVVFFGVSFDRQLAPRGDISQWVRGAVRNGPQEPVTVEGTGVVADAPRRNEFGQEFPLAVTRMAPEGPSAAIKVTAGTVWVRAPREVRLYEGDVLEVRGELTDLPRAGNPGERQMRARYVGARCWSLLRIKNGGTDAGRLTVVQRDPSALAARLAGWRAALQGRYRDSFEGSGRAYPATTAALLSAMVLGDRAGEPLPAGTRDAFRAAGLTHLLVASGSQVALLCALILGAGRALNLRGGLLLGCALAVLVLYALLTGGAASIWRAAIAGGCLAFAVAAGRPVDRLSLLALAFVALLCLDAAQIQDIGFQLTFAATWGLAVLAPAVARWLRGLALGETPAQLLGATLGAQLATLPFLLYHFGRAGVQGFAANAVVLPMAALLVGCGLLGLVFPPANALNYALVNGIREVAETAAGWPGAHAVMAPLGLLPAALFSLVLMLMAVDSSELRAIARDEMRRVDWHKPAKGGAALVGLLLLLSLWRGIGARDDKVRVTLLDVGQGESIAIVRGNEAVLIDAGSSDSEGRRDVGMSVVVPFLQSQGVQKLAALVITHADADHCNAMMAVLREVPVDRVIDGAGNRPPDSLLGEADYQEVRREIRRRQIPVVAASAGQKLRLGDASWEFLAPMLPSLPGDNDDGAVVMLEHGTFRMLFTADIEREGEERLARRADIKCDVLKLAHHGSATSTGEAFLHAARPNFAVLSCGRYNSFGHPSVATLSRLAKAGVPVDRTDRDGAVTVVSDGRGFQIETFR